MELFNSKPVAMKGIKSATEFIFSYKNGKTEDVGEKASVTYYDENGYETECQVIGPDDKPIFKTLNSYNESGMLSEKKFCNLSDGKETIRKFDYDSSNRLIKETFWSESTGTIIRELIYNPEDILLEEHSYSPLLKQVKKEHYEYYPGEHKRDKFSSTFLISSFIEDSNPGGRKTKEILFNNAGKVEESILTKYNAKNLPIKCVKYTGPDQKLSTVTYKYDGKDRLIEEIFTGELPSFTKRYFYNGSGNLSVLTVFKENGEPEFTYKTLYEYYKK